MKASGKTNGLRRRALKALALLAPATLAAAFLAPACGGGSYCRENPRDCYGEIGGGCRSDRDCFEGECCRSDNCGGGMCTYSCRDDRDCPSDMLCEHGTCFFQCFDDRDCGPGQSCEHGNTICEYDD